MATPKTSIILTADDRTKEAFASVRRNIGAMRSESGALGAAMRGLIPAVSVAALASFAKSGIDAADSLNDISQRLGVSVKDLASFKLAAEQSGTSLDGIGAGIARLNKSIGEADAGNKKLAATLATLGVTARDPKEAFFQLADAVERIQSPTERAALLSQVLGKNYQELIPLLSQGSAELRKSATASESFADAMARLAPEADRFNDNMASLKINAAGAAGAILAELVPALNQLFERFSNLRNLVNAGGLFNSFALTGTVAEDLKKVRAEIALTEKAIASKKSSGRDTSLFDEKLRQQKAQLAFLTSQAAAAINAPPQTETQRLLKASRSAGLGSGASGAATKVRSARSKGVDSEAAAAADLADAWKLADEELKRYAEDRAFLLEGDIERDNAINAIAQEWAEAGRILTDEVRTPLENANIEFGRLDELLSRGVITWETYSRAVLNVQDSLEGAVDAVVEMDVFAKTAAENIQNSFADFLFDPFENGLQGMAESFGKTIQRMIADAVAADLARKLFGSLTEGGSGDGLVGGLLSGLGSLMNFDGGGYTGAGSRTGGVDGKGGFLSVLHPNETVLDHTKGQRGGGGTTIVVNVNGSNNAPDVRRAAGQGAREALGMMAGAQRYA